MLRRPTDPRRYSVELDGYSRSSAKLAQPAFLEHLVRTVASAASMRILNICSSNIEKDLTRMSGQVFSDEGGFSVLALISTSHIALHTWPERRAFMFDLVSCRPFEAQQVLAFLKRELQVEETVHERVGEKDDGTERRSDGAVRSEWGATVLENQAALARTERERELSSSGQG